MSTALPGPLQRPFFFFFTAAHSFNMLTLNVSPLVFPQWSLGKILQKPQVCALWPSTNISEVIQATERFGLGPSAFVYLYFSLQVHGFLRALLTCPTCWGHYLSVFACSCMCSSIYDSPMCLCFCLLVNSGTVDQAVFECCYSIIVFFIFLEMMFQFCGSN